MRPQYLFCFIFAGLTVLPAHAFNVSDYSLTRFGPVTNMVYCLDLKVWESDRSVWGLCTDIETYGTIFIKYSLNGTFLTNYTIPTTEYAFSFEIDQSDGSAYVISFGNITLLSRYMDLGRSYKMVWKVEIVNEGLNSQPKAILNRSAGVVYVAYTPSTAKSCFIRALSMANGTSLWQNQAIVPSFRVVQPICHTMILGPLGDKLYVSGSHTNQQTWFVREIRSTDGAEERIYSHSDSSFIRYFPALQTDPTREGFYLVGVEMSKAFFTYNATIFWMRFDTFIVTPLMTFRIGSDTGRSGGEWAVTIPNDAILNPHTGDIYIIGTGAPVQRGTNTQIFLYRANLHVSNWTETNTMITNTAMDDIFSSKMVLTRTGYILAMLRDANSPIFLKHSGLQDDVIVSSFLANPLNATTAPIPGPYFFDLLPTDKAFRVRRNSITATSINGQSCLSPVWDSSAPLRVRCSVPNGVGIMLPITISFGTTQGRGLFSYDPPRIIGFTFGPDKAQCAGGQTISMHVWGLGSRSESAVIRFQLTTLVSRIVTNYTKPNDATLNILTPPCLRPGPVLVYVTVGKLESAPATFNYSSPKISSITPSQGLSPDGTHIVNITGVDFGNCGVQCQTFVQFQNDVCIPIIVSNTFISCQSPATHGQNLTVVLVYREATSVPVRVNLIGGSKTASATPVTYIWNTFRTSAKVSYSEPVLNSISPMRARNGDLVTFKGTNMGTNSTMIRIVFFRESDGVNEPPLIERACNSLSLFRVNTAITNGPPDSIVCTLPSLFDDVYKIRIEANGFRYPSNLVLYANDANMPPYFEPSISDSIQTYENTYTAVFPVVKDPDNDQVKLAVYAPPNGMVFQWSDTAANNVGPLMRNTPGSSVEVVDAFYRFVYRPNDYYYGEDSILLWAMDYKGGYKLTTISITVYPVNQPPEFATPTMVFTLNDETDAFEVTIRVVEHDRDQNVILTWTKPPTRGLWYHEDRTTRVDFTQTITYWNGDSVKLYMVHDGLGGGPSYANMQLIARDTGSPPSTSEITQRIVIKVECPPMLYNNVWSTGKVCLPCPVGAICSENGDFKPFNAHGYYPLSNSTFIPCNPPEACGMGAASQSVGSTICNAGYRGLRCGQCAASYYRLGNYCTRCADWLSSPILAVIILIVACIVMIVLFYWIRKYDLGFVSLLLTFLQTLAILTKTKITWPAFVESMLNAFSFLNFNIELVSPECYSRDENSKIYELKYYATITAPLIIGLIVLMMLGSQKAYKKFSRQRVDHTAVSRSSTPVLTDPSTSRPVSRTASREELRRQRSIDLLDTDDKVQDTTQSFEANTAGTIVASFLLILRVLYITLARKSLEIFDCMYDENSGYSFFKPEPSRKCFVEQWWYDLLPMAIISTLIYVIGIPLIFAFLLVKRMKIRKMQPDEWTQRDRFILMITFKKHNDLKQGNEYYDVLVIIRELAIVLTQLFFASFTGLQACALICIFILALIWALEREPYTVQTMNFLESVTLISSILILLAGTAFELGEVSGSGTDALGVLVVIVVTTAIGLVIYNLGLHLRESWNGNTRTTVDLSKTTSPKSRLSGNNRLSRFIRNNSTRFSDL